MKNCVVCDQKGNIGIGGVLLCPIHAAEVREEIDRLRGEGKTVDAARIALKLKKESEEDFIVHFPKGMRQNVRIYARSWGMYNLTNSKSSSVCKL